MYLVQTFKIICLSVDRANFKSFEPDYNMHRLINYHHFLSDSVLPGKQLQLCNELTRTRHNNQMSRRPEWN